MDYDEVPRLTAGNPEIFHHLPVLLEETMTGLKLRSGGIYVDCTAGGGGHSTEILRRTTPNGRLIAIDQDPAAVAAVTNQLASYVGRFTVVRENFAHLARVLEQLGTGSVDGVLMDLGVSSYQLDNPARGFSYMHDAPLDMRMDPAGPVTAAVLVNTLGAGELTEIIRRYGEERWAARIASFVISGRQTGPITTTGQLVELIKAAIPAKARRQGPHPAKRTFQALRIAVNGELELLEGALRAAVDVLAPGGRICVITFHSLEDRTVKEVFRELTGPCRCPRDFPRCVCGAQARLKVITGRPIVPSEEELADNPRSRSAKLRVAEKVQVVLNVREVE